MKNLVKFILTLAVLFTSSVVPAQDQIQKRTPEERAQNQVQWMQKNLAITDDQGKKAHDIILRYAQQAESMKNSNAAGGSGQMQEMQTAKDNEIKGILTGDQYQKYEAHVQEMQEKMRARRAAGGQWGGN